MEMSHSNLAILVILLLTIRRLFQYKRKNLPPSPFGLPIIGHLHLLKTPLHHSLQTLSSKYGPVLFLKFGVRPVVVVSSSSTAEECFTKNDIIFANRPRNMASDHLTYNGNSLVWLPYGDHWRNLRRLAVVEIFSTKSIQKYSHVREDEVRWIIRRLLKDSGGGGMRKVELKLFVSLLIINVTMKVISGRRYIDEDVFDEKIEKQKLQEFKDKFFSSLTTNLCDFIPFLRLIGYKGIEKNMLKLHGIRDEFLQKLVDDVRSRRNSDIYSEISDAQKNSIIETLLSLQDSEPEFVTDKVVKSMILMMLIAGTETSLITLEWAMTLLLNHPEKLHKVRIEIDRNVGHERLLNDSDLVKLPYLRHVIDETLRLYPPAPLLLPHFSTEPCTIGSFYIPKRTTLMVNVGAIHRDPRIWENPDVFRPERFESLSSSERESCIFLPFGTGRRVCPGSSMGLNIVSLALGSLIQCFEWRSVSQSGNMTYDSGLTVYKANSSEAMCSPRQNILKALSYI